MCNKNPEKILKCEYKEISRIKNAKETKMSLNRSTEMRKYLRYI